MLFNKNKHSTTTSNGNDIKIDPVMKSEETSRNSDPSNYEGEKLNRVHNQTPQDQSVDNMYFTNNNNEYVKRICHSVTK